MENTVKIFSSKEFGEVRTVTIDNEPWFVGKDVAEALKYNEPHKAISRHVLEDDRMKHPVTDSSGREKLPGRRDVGKLPGRHDVGKLPGRRDVGKLYSKRLQAISQH